MPSVQRNSSRTPGAWSGAPGLIEKWLARRCAVEATINFAGGAVFLVIGLVALIFTSVATAGIALFVLVGANGLLACVGFSVSLFQPGLFAILFVFFLALTVLHAYRTRWGSESAAEVDLGTAFASFRSLGWEFMAAGPILLILAGQDFYRCVRLSRMDLPHVSALLLWLYDKGGRAGFAEICLAFPGLNSVRVLPQLRDLPGINWWAEQGEISLSDDLRGIFAELLGRPSKSSPFPGSSAHSGQHFKSPVAEAGMEIIAWYAALNLPLFAPLKQVKARYRALAKIHHPDAQSKSRAAGRIPDDEQMKRINEAYHNILKHSQKQAGIHH